MQNHVTIDCDCEFILSRLKESDVTQLHLTQNKQNSTYSGVQSIQWQYMIMWPTSHIYNIMANLLRSDLALSFIVLKRNVQQLDKGWGPVGGGIYMGLRVYVYTNGLLTS